jgi:hypothetical protein
VRQTTATTCGARTPRSTRPALHPDRQDDAGRGPDAPLHRPSSTSAPGRMGGAVRFRAPGARGALRRPKAPARLAAEGPPRVSAPTRSAGAATRSASPTSSA